MPCAARFLTVHPTRCNYDSTNHIQTLRDRCCDATEFDPAIARFGAAQGCNGRWAGRITPRKLTKKSRTVSGAAIFAGEKAPRFGRELRRFST